LECGLTNNLMDSPDNMPFGTSDVIILLPGFKKTGALHFVLDYIGEQMVQYYTALQARFAYAEGVFEK